jgi:hypothetical protein
MNPEDSVVNTVCVYCAVRAEPLSVIQANFIVTMSGVKASVTINPSVCSFLLWEIWLLLRARQLLEFHLQGDVLSTHNGLQWEPCCMPHPV